MSATSEAAGDASPLSEPPLDQSAHEQIPAEPGGDEAPLDLSRIQADINEEVRRRRASGDFPPGLERELDAVFARYAPAGVGDDFDAVMDSAETQSFVHADVPTGSRVPAAAYVKRFVRKLTGWYARFLTQQITAFNGAITRAVRLLGARVDDLEVITVRAGERSLAEIRDHRPSPDLSGWVELVVAEMAPGRGRVLHTECGAGATLIALAAAGVDAYGVEPVEKLAVDASQSGLDVRGDDALAHLRALPESGLGGLVLSGCVDNRALGELLEIADRAAAVVAPGGRVVVLSEGPAAWARHTDPLVADLAPGRPLHPETWCHLLGERGFRDLRVDTGSSAGEALRTVPADVGGADVLNANIERLNRLLFTPSAYAVVATRHAG